LHLLVALLRLGFKVGSMDIDARQRSLSRYLDNRKQTMTTQNVKLPMPQHVVVAKSQFSNNDEIEADERERFTRSLAKLLVYCDFVVIDAPGNDTYLARLAHSFADTVITPINDSFVDLDVLAAIDGQTLNILKPSIYSEMLWEQKMQRVRRDGGSIDWVVMRNRLSNIDARNKRTITKIMAELQRRLGFRQAPGFSERVIFREMFLLGLTVLDVLETGASRSLTMSHLAARQEVRELLQALRIPAIDAKINAIQIAENTDKSADAPKTEAAPIDSAPSAAPENIENSQVAEEN
jgi:chromosome partitioning protein